MFVIKTEISNTSADVFNFDGQKTMYGGKSIVVGDLIFIIASEIEGGAGLVAMGLVTSAKPVPLKFDLTRQTPRISIGIQRTALVKRRWGRSELKSFADWNDGRPETELNFKLYRQPTNKIVGVSSEAATFLHSYF